MTAISLNCAFDSADFSVDALGAFATEDYALWGDNNLGAGSTTPRITKSGGGSTLSLTTNTSILNYNLLTDFRQNWTGGTPTGSGTNVPYILVTNPGGGTYFEVTAPAGLAERELWIWVGQGLSNDCVVLATLSGGGAGPASNSDLSGTTSDYHTGLVKVTYTASSDGQTIAVRITANNAPLNSSNVDISAAAWAFTSAPPATSTPSRLLTLGVG